MRFFRSSLLCKILLLILVLFQLTVAEAATGKRKTQTLTLENGMDVWLISDPDVQRSAAAISVGTGHLYDPAEKNGLAHYLEHMLFLGTKKYPDVESFKKFLSENSGGSNAYTAGNQTNYFFEISHDAYEGALDRFSDFFRSPLFDEVYAEREVNAVSSEHDKNRLSDGWRARRVIDLISEPGHPLQKFGTGNNETLAGDNREALRSFHKKFYSASNMKLAMISNESLHHLTEQAKEFFANIPSYPVEIPAIAEEFRKPLKGKYRLLKIKSVKDIRLLDLQFSTIHLKSFEDSKPANIVGSLVGHEGRGSLLSKLKEEGLALGLSAGGGSSHPNINSFNIGITLTPKGEQNYERILDLFFSYIHMIKEHGIAEYTYKENQTISQINFDWKDPEEGMGFVASHAALMHDFPLNDVETLPFLYRKFDLPAYKKLLDTLTLENALITLQSNSLKTDKTEKFYGTEYSIEEVGGKAFEKLAHPHKVEGMAYPVRNEFIPSNLVLLEDTPHLVRNDDLAKVWFKFDNRFKQPKVYMKLRIETPQTYKSPSDHAKAQLYESAVQEGLNEIVYPIQLAGLSYAMSIEKKGVILTVGGYSERVSDLVQLVVKNLLDLKIDEQKFSNIKEAMIRSLQNARMEQALSRGGYYNRLLWLVKQYNEEELIAALQQVTLDQVKDYAKSLYEKVYITGVAHGNWTDENVAASLQTLLNETKSRSLPGSERFKQAIEVLSPGENIRFARKIEDNNNALSYTLQVGDFDLPTHARTSMLASLVETDFYTQMRTNQQLGYVVWSFGQRIEDRLFLRFVIQSAVYGPGELTTRVEKWFEDMGSQLDKLPDEEFEKHRQSMILSLEKQGDSLAEVTSEMYTLATEEKGNFAFKDQLIKIVENLKKEEVVAFGKNLIGKGDVPRILVMIRSRENGETIPPGVITEVEQFKSRKKD